MVPVVIIKKKFDWSHKYVSYQFFKTYFNPKNKHYLLSTLALIFLITGFLFCNHEESMKYGQRTKPTKCICSL